VSHPRLAVVLLLSAAGGGGGCRGFSGLETPAPQVVRISARRFEYTPSRIVLRRGRPVVLELTSEDRTHGFKVPELGLRADLEPGAVTRLELTPERVGTFEFACDHFCGDGHEDMTGELVVEP
jgi:cytochrome c oxidase subunit 2